MSTKPQFHNRRAVTDHMKRPGVLSPKQPKQMLWEDQEGGKPECYFSPLSEGSSSEEIQLVCCRSYIK